MLPSHTDRGGFIQSTASEKRIVTPLDTHKRSSPVREGWWAFGSAVASAPGDVHHEFIVLRIISHSIVHSQASKKIYQDCKTAVNQNIPSPLWEAGWGPPMAPWLAAVSRAQLGGYS